MDLADHGVNDGIDAALSSLQYSSVDHTVAMVSRPIGRGVPLAKQKRLPHHSYQFILTQVAVDTVWLFGLRGLCQKIFFSVADALFLWIMHAPEGRQLAMLSTIWMIFSLPEKC